MEGRKKVAFFEVEPWEKDYFEDKLGGRAEMVFHPERLTLDNIDLATDADYLAVFVYSDLSGRALDLLPHLRGVATMSVGFDHIDIEEAEKKKIIISNVPAYGPNTVAEHTIALLLALSRNIVPSVERTKEELYDYRGLSGWDLSGKTLGIIGTGKIGALVARIASGLNMKIIAFDPHQNQEIVDKYQVEYLEMPALLARSDVITLHVPMCPENKWLLGKDEFSKMKKGVVILNTARGGLVDPDALLEALNNGIVSQAGIDVLEDEGLLKEEKQFMSPYFKLKDYQTALIDHALMRHPKVLVTPHNAFNSREALRNILDTTVKNLEGMMEGDPVNVVEK
ncbi:MAG TPA: NAD(P)-dependent oxidoreductase [Candidatus Saccharimonadales bacterium]|nr:NAD(P)-dependent oxidoreductase [Candidatus Saccharimonadales bacterium]